MKVLIAGATGLVGTVLKKYLKTKNIDVHCLTRNQSIAKSDSKSFYWNPKKNIIDESCFRNVHAVVNLAGTRVSRSWTKKGKQILIDSRIQSTQLLRKSIENLKTHQIAHYVTASAIGIYSSKSNQLQTEENFKMATSFLSSLVQDWEREACKFESNKIKTTITRFGHVFSNQGGFYPILDTFLFNRLGFILGNGNQIYSWIHIDDVVRIIYQILKERWLGTYNLVSPECISQKELTRIISKYKAPKTMLLTVPSKLIKIVLGERSQLVLNGQSVSAQKLLNKGYVFRFPTTESCVENLKVTK
ncbi:MAG: TIGR01777 family oxidoreductase [Flavobacteriaceae bacterium]|nr:TIGR01777 family oxidoreductase [Flavobacteriaceae bacterium]